jgi:ectoine hydroxylase-related dioxygenase (phytanoyl-CoA dioxygenase family)
MTRTQSAVDESGQASQLTDEQRRQLETDGCAVIPGVLSEDECDGWSSIIDEAWERERLGQHDYRDEPGVQFVENLLRCSSVFERCAIEPVVVDGIREVLGPEVYLSLVNGRRTDPKYGNQPLHELDRRRGRPYVLCDAIWCLDEFTSLNGTRVIPGTHADATRFLATLEDPLLPHPDERTIEAPRGAVFIFNAGLIHAGQTNCSDRPRRSIQSQFTVFKDQLHYDWSALPQALRQSFRDETLRMLALASGNAAAD